MDLKDIIDKAHELSSPEDLLNLLNEIKKDELGDKAFPFNMYQLKLYCNPNRTEGRYHDFQIPKKHNKGFRTISAPNNGLKSLQTTVKDLLEALYTPSPNTMGFIKGRSIVENARRHLHQNYVYNIDLKDFFPSISQARVWARLQLPPFKFPKEIASIIAGICSIKVPYKTADGKNAFKYVLPQGAPTSPVLSNAVCEKLDRRLTGLSKRFNVNFTRYADDITFSSMSNVFKKQEFKDELLRIIEEQNFRINEDKTRLQTAGSHQEVTGLTVGEKVNVSKEYVRSVRSLLHIWGKYGYNEAYRKYYDLYLRKNLTRKKKDAVPPMESYISGKLNYLKMVKGPDDGVYRRLYSLYLWLNAKGNENPYSLPPDLEVLSTWTFDEFQKIHHTKIRVAKSRNGNLFWTCSNLNTPHTISCHRSVKENTDKDKVVISSCMRSSGYVFYLAHLPFQAYKDPVSVLMEQQLDSIIDVWQNEGIKNSKELLLTWVGSIENRRLRDIDFIDLLSNALNLSESQRGRIQRLMVRDLKSGVLSKSYRQKTEEGGKEESNKEGKMLHDPKLVQNFMQAFSRNDTLKYTTHVWERNVEGKYKWPDFDSFYNAYRKELTGSEDRSLTGNNMSIWKLHDYSRSLQYTIMNFLFPHKDGEKRVWDKEHGLNIGYCYPEGLMSQWMEDNPNQQPYAMPLSVYPEELQYNKRIGGRYLSNFEDLVNVFKHDIRVVDDELYYLFRQVFRGTDYVIDEEALDTLKGYSFYTDVQGLKSALQIIESNISNRPQYNQVRILANYDKEKGKLAIGITQIGSFSDKQIDDGKLMLTDPSGQMLAIKKCLQSLCDFSVISRFRKDSKLGNYKIDYLYNTDSNAAPQIEPMSGEAEGFTYLLTFYIV